MNTFTFIVNTLEGGKVGVFTKKVEAATPSRAWIDVTTRLGHMFSGTNTTVYKIEMEPRR